MAINLNSNINLKGIVDNINSSNISLNLLKTSIDKTSGTLREDTKDKKIIGDNLKKIYNKRLEITRREEENAEIDENSILTNPDSGINVIQSSGESTVSKLFSTLSFLGSGWILYNMAGWVDSSKKFSNRTESLVSNINNTYENTNIILQEFGNSLENLTGLFELDRLENLNDIFSKDFLKIDKNILDIGDTIVSLFDDILKFVKDPISSAYPYIKGLLGFGDNKEGPGEGSVGSSYGTPEQRALLDTLAYAEGTDGRPLEKQYMVMLGGGLFSVENGWRHPRKIIGNVSDAAGRYQFLSTTWDMAAKALGLKDFSPENQDRAALFLVDRRLGGNSAAILKKNGLTKDIVAKLAPEWASLPTLAGVSFHGQPVKKYKDLMNYYNSRVKFQETEQSKAKDNERFVETSGDIEFKKLPKMPPTNTYPGQYFGAPRKGGRKHAGVDYQIYGNQIFYSRIGGYVKLIDFEKGVNKYGHYIDIYNPMLGLIERIAEGGSLLINKIGAKVNVGDPVSVGTSTGVIHYELRKAPKGYRGMYHSENVINPEEFLYSPRYKSYIEHLKNKGKKPPEITPKPQTQAPLTPAKPVNKVSVIPINTPRQNNTASAIKPSSMTSTGGVVASLYDTRLKELTLAFV